MRKLINWFNANGLYVITLFLLAFIPLYPKIPLLDITQTWVSIRFEDILVALAALVLFITFIREKRVSDAALRRPIITYWIIGCISLVNALLFIFPHLSGVLFPHLAILHFIRRIEYMSLFFVAYEAFKKNKNIIPLLWTLGGSYLVIILYGFGQKFLGFPAFLTMNEEFAKGLPLRLPANARFPSTFGGHYDLAAYLVLVIPIMGSLLFGMKKVWHKILFFVLALLGLEMLLFTASRISFGVYLVAMSVMLLWNKKSLWIVPMVVVSLVVMTFTSGASERFYKTFSVSNVIVDLSTGKTIGTLDQVNGTQATLQPIASPAQESLPRGSQFISLASTDEISGEQIKQVQFYKSVDVDGAVGDMATVSGSFLVQKALVYDISITTRFQGEWPKAMEAFKRNLLLGSGYSSLSVATDGDYHRMLGETGILGAVAFLGIFAAAFHLFRKHQASLLPVERAFVVGLFAGIVGLMVNAILIDVFEASKVAFTLWALLGIAIAILMRGKKIAFHYFTLLKHIATRPAAYIVYLFIVIILIWGKTFHLYFLGDDFTWLRWAATSKLSDISSFFTNAQGFWYRPIPKLWYFGLFSVFWLMPSIYHGLSVILLLVTAFYIYRILTLRSVGRQFAWGGALLFAALSIHHENVYWVSGQSSMLAGFFLISAVYLNEESYGLFRRFPKFVIGILMTALTLLSMFSYDGMVIAPAIVVFLAYTKNKKNIWPWMTILCIPYYLWMRSQAMALAPQGNYGYKANTFLVNTISNTVGYIVAAFLGPKLIEVWNNWRVISRSYLKEITIGVLLVAFGIAALVLKKWKILQSYREAVVWFIAFGIALAAYAPLGGMADRYVYIPSMFLIVSFILMLSEVCKKTKQWVLEAIICAAFFGLLGWNIKEVQRLGGDWEFASKTVEQALLVIKKETYPPKDIKTFFFVPTIPIRYGSAWIFPTGMDDAIWHMYRQSPYRIFTMPTIEEAYKFPLTMGDREIFVFENYKLKRGVRETKYIPVTPMTKQP